MTWAAWYQPRGTACRGCRARYDPARSMSESPQVRTAVVGTAGHIDHGKSSLVKALTGIDPDRLKEEQERGITIDLGFARYSTRRTAPTSALVDVPGHERFVRNMVAGATGIDVVLLVVAADDGVMPQTREHLEILQLLGIARRVRRAHQDRPRRRRGCGSSPRRTSATLVRGHVPRGRARSSGARTRRARGSTSSARRSSARCAPCRRATSGPRSGCRSSARSRAKGHGTVVTGIPLSGRDPPGGRARDPAGGHARPRPRPPGAPPRRRSTGPQGHRVAVNLTDVAWKDVHRGDVLASAGLFAPTTGVEVRFRLLDSAKDVLESHEPVRFHAGCAEVLGRLVLIDRRAAPARRGRARAGAPRRARRRRARRPVPRPAGVGRRGRSAAASSSASRGFARSRARPGSPSNLASKEQSLGDPEGYLAATVRGEGLRPVALDRLPQLVHEDAGAGRPAARALVEKGVLVELDCGRAVLHAEAVEVGAAEIEKALLTLHEKDHYAFGFGAQDVANLIRHERAAIDLFAERGVAAGRLEKQQGQYRAKAFKGGLSQEDRRLIGWVEEKLRATGLASPSAAEMAKELNKPEKRIMNLITLLQAQGKAQVIGDGVVLHATAVERSARQGRPPLPGDRRAHLDLREGSARLDAQVRDPAARALRQDRVDGPEGVCRAS